MSVSAVWQGEDVPGPAEWFFLLGAGTLAGVIGTAGGITSLVAYPALLVVGLPPLVANVTTSVALLGSGFSSALRARPDLVGHRRTLVRWVPTTVVMSLLGAVLLVRTPSGVFARLAPVLILVGSAILVLQPVIARWQGRRPTPPGRAAAGLAGAAVAVYNGYFGAGAGILLIALLMLTTESVLYRANSLKNVILFTADLLPVAVFAAAGAVRWADVWPVGLGALAGGLIGPAIARRVPAAVLRLLIAACGVILAGWLFVDP